MYMYVCVCILYLLSIKWFNGPYGFDSVPKMYKWERYALFRHT